MMNTHVCLTVSAIDQVADLDSQPDIVCPCVLLIGPVTQTVDDVCFLFGDCEW